MGLNVEGAHCMVSIIFLEHIWWLHVLRLIKICYSSDNVSFEPVYVGWDFGDHHYDNSKTISDYNTS
jgi:hypothetical protein